MKHLITGTLLLLAGVAYARVAAWAQCGGQGWTGEKSCTSGCTCTPFNSWYSQCLPSDAPGHVNATIPRATFTQITNFGSNPTDIRAWIYVPKNLAPKPPIVVGIHWCTGTAIAFYNASSWNYLADQKGFIVIYPESPNSDGCWDVHSAETLTHNGGGDSLGIVSAVRWTIRNFHANASKVFATGISSGAMMTNVLIGAYPDVFAAGSASPGVPFGCFEGPDRWNNECSSGNLTKTPQEWGDRVRAAYPGYKGPRPKMQFWHGTIDEGLNYHNFGEEVKQWTNVLGVSMTPTNTVLDYPLSGWTRYDYGPKVMGISAEGVPHNIPYQPNLIMEWFGL
ncbi:carbohydrate esterase family 1 protein [Serendipita vermifera MAFF 305830]|uniref:Carboxylic ester hydrolase n=1 Tax=Serendipita vermifera MAFF 305830 TaxID=933852 RepID=A0A0C3AGP3_SERVB|nr:carbohydrate esterase family 1 protein [Serendipita vermifera MAFF 305830]